MKWPNHADYAEAIQNPELCFELPELHTGEVANTTLGLPRAWSGNFASVYQVTGGGRAHAVRCFVRQVTNQQDRYAALARYLAGRPLDFMVPFDFVNRGIRVHDAWYPMVKMDWVTGTPLHTYVESKLGAPEALAWLAADWRLLSGALKRHRIGHGDLQHGNVLVTGTGALKLVDYDGVYVPLFSRERSPELGHANYQHPRRGAEFYDERLDHFSALLIYVSLRALAAEPGLWKEFFNGDNLLATAVDLRVPQCADLWPRLLRSPDEDVRRLTVRLIESLRLAPADVPDLETLLGPGLSEVNVPVELEFGSQLVARRAGEHRSSTVAESMGSLLPGPLAALQPGDHGGKSRVAPALPDPADVLSWSALAAALVSLAPALRLVGAPMAIGLGLLACLIRGGDLRRTRVAAVGATLLGALGLLLRPGFPVAARPSAEAALPPLEVVDLPSSLPMADAQPSGSAIDHAPPVAATTSGFARQPVSRPLAPAFSSFARRVNDWKPHAGPVASLATTSDGRFIVSAGAERTIAAWNTASRQLAFVRGDLPEPILALTALTNLAIVAALDSTHHLRWWSLDGAVPLKAKALDPDSLFPPVISRDGHVIAISGPDRRSVLLEFDGDASGTRLIPGLSSWAKLVRFAPNRRSMAVVCHDDTIALHRVAGGAPMQVLHFLDAAITDVVYSPDGESLAAVGAHGGLRIWNPTTGAQVAERQLPFSRAQLVWLNRRRSELLVAGDDGRLLCLNAANALVLRDEVQTAKPVTSLIELADGSGFVTGHASGEVGLWQLEPESSVEVRQFARP